LVNIKVGSFAGTKLLDSTVLCPLFEK